MPRARVLAVDDQRYFRELIEALLSEEGYEVHTASSGEEALHVLEREDFDIVLTDLVMPGLDGCQLVERVKQRLPEQDIIMITGVVDVKTAVEAMKLGASDYLLKPFERDDLRRTLDTTLQRKRLRDEHSRLMAENLEYMSVLSLYERATGLFSTLTLEPLAERLIEGLCLETRAQGGVLWLADEPEAARLRLLAARGIVRTTEEPSELDPETLGEAFAPLLGEGRSLVRSARGSAAALWVPLRHAGRLLGLARLTDKLDGGRFGDRDRAKAEKFVALGAAAVSNAVRFRALERRSFRDPLTKAYTESYFEDVVRNEIQKANRCGHAFSILRADLGDLGRVERRLGEGPFGHWLERVVHHLGLAARSSDLVAAHSDRRYSIFLPEADALGAAAVKQRVAGELRQSGILAEIGEGAADALALGAASFPGDGTQLEALERCLEARLEEHRRSLLHSARLAERSFAETIAALAERGAPERPATAAQVTRFLLGELRRRAQERTLLFLAPAGPMAAAADEGLRALSGLRLGADVVVLGERGPGRAQPSAATWISPDRLRVANPFAILFGDGPAYAMVLAPGANGALPFFHTSDRALVEHLAFRLQRDLGIPMSA